MLNKPNPEEMLPKVANRYELVNVIAKRARQLADGDEPKIKSNELSKVTIASLEFAQDELQLIKE